MDAGIKTIMREYNMDSLLTVLNSAITKLNALIAQESDDFIANLQLLIL